MLKTQGSFKKRIVGLTVVTATVSALVLGLVRDDVAPIEAHRTTYKGISEIAENSNSNSDDIKPFIILEVVSDKKDASIGYLIGGEEPIYEGESLKDMPVAEERTQKWTDFTNNFESREELLNELKDADALKYDLEGYSEGTGDNQLSIKGIFQEKENGDYTPKDLSLTYIPMNKSSNPVYREIAKNIAQIYEGGNSYGIVLYNKIIEFNTAYGSGIDIVLRKVEADEVMPKFMQGSYEDGNDVYNGQYFEVRQIADDTGLYEDSMVFVAEGDELRYFGRITNDPDYSQYVDTDDTTSEDEIEDETEEDSNPEDENPDGEQDENGGTTDPSEDATDGENGEKNTDGEDTEGESQDENVPEEPLINGGNSQFLCITPDGNPVQLGSLRVGNYYRVRETNHGDLYDDYYVIDRFYESGGAFGKKVYYKAVPGSLYGSYNAPANRTYYLNEMGSDEFNYEPGRGTYEFITDYSRPEVTYFNYKGGFSNSEWFKQYVLDRTTTEEYLSTNVDVVTVTPNEVTTELISKAGLVYINVGGSAYNDISEESASAILGGAKERTLSVMLEKSSLVTVDGEVVDTNMDRLLVMLMQRDSIPEVPQDWDSQNWSDLLDTIYDGYELDTGKKYDASHVLGTVFVNDDTVEGKKKIVADNFFRPYKDTDTDGFKAIIDFNNKEKEKIEYLFQDSGWKEFDRSISKATSIKYIINAGRSYNESKGALNILDLEPYQSGHFALTDIVGNSVAVEQDKLTKDWFIDNIGSEYADNRDSITITEMGTHEFIGRNENLNETYDMIYIGMDTTIMNSDVDSSGTKTRNTTYIDSEMNGLVYVHMGDKFAYDGTGSDAGYKGNYRVTGTDITLDKYNALKKYIETGYAVLLSNDFFLSNADGTVTINTGRVDSSSYMYKLMKDVVLAQDGDVYKYYGKNVNIRSAFEKSDNNNYLANREYFSNFLNLSKLEVNMISAPTSWAPTSWSAESGEPQGTYLDPGADGIYHLNYEVELSSGTSKLDSMETYTCKLYIDADGDGKFEDPSKANPAGEEIGIYIIDDNGGYVNQNELKVGNTYSIQAALDSDYVGFISWRLVFLQNNTDEDVNSYYTKDIRVSKSGFCAIRATGNRPTIKVLQIYSANGSAGNEKNNLKMNSEEMKAKYAKVADFDINVELINVEDFVNMEKTTVHNMGGSDGILFDSDCKTHIEFLNKYDMIVFGFTDYSKFYGNDDKLRMDAIKAIREYTLSGKSVLFTHDITTGTYNGGNNHEGNWFNRYMRDVIGQDRFGVTQANLLKERITGDAYDYNSKYDTAELKNVSQDALGLADTTILRYASDKNGMGYLHKSDTKYWNDKVWHEKQDKVTMLNEGQVTQYPFIITTKQNDSFDVSPTHPQVYQLNLDTDSSDDNNNDDIVVWYTLGNAYTYADGGANVGAFLQGVPNDARNNYYIYSRGNVFYTGAGHREVTLDKERNLFVNTLVAAYKSGNQTAKVIFKEKPAESATNINSLYVPYDPNMQKAGSDTTGGFLTDYVTVHFQAMNNSIKDSSLDIKIKFYVKGEINDWSLKVGEGENAEYYREITPQSLLDVGTGYEISGGNVVNNYRLYTAKFNNSDFKLESAGEKAGEVDYLYVRVSTENLEDSEFATLNPSESINALRLYSVKLFDLE